MRKLMIKGGLVLTVGNVVSAVASFLRNILVARLISVEDFGIASLFALTMSVVEMASNLSIDKIIVQAADGNEPVFQATGQAFQVVRGIVGGVILFFAAEYVSAFFNVSHVAWAFQYLALIPVIRGFSHLDMARFHREMKFSPAVWAETVPQIITLGMAWPLAIWLGDYSVMLWVIIAQAFTTTLFSHLLSERPYRWAWNAEVVSRMLQFGWPLLINGVLMFVIFQGDKAIVGKAFSMETLGWYSAAFTLTLAPAMLAGKISQSLLLPFLSKAQNDVALFKQRCTITIQSYLVIGLGVGLVFSFAGVDLLTLLYGHRYSNGATVIAWLGLMQAVGVAKAGPMITAMALGETKNPMLSNIVRGLAFLLAIAVVFFGGGVKAVAITGLIGELLAYFVSIWLLKYRLRLAIDKFMLPVFAFIAASILMAILGEMIHYENNRYLQWIYALMASTVGVAVCMSTMPELASKIRHLLANLLASDQKTLSKIGNEGDGV